MGGVLIKEMLVRAMDLGAPAHHAAMADAATGLVFFATPHRGSWLADVGWNLRYVGASPAASVMHLKPGPHLEVELLSRLVRQANVHMCSRLLVCHFDPLDSL